MVVMSLFLAALMQTQDVEAVFVDEAPAAVAELQRIERDTLDPDVRRQRLLQLIEDHGDRLVPVSDDEPGCLVEVRHRVAALLGDPVAVNPDALRHARLAAASGATASALRWLQESNATSPLARTLWFAQQPVDATSTFTQGEPLPDDLVPIPLWTRTLEDNAAAPLLTGDQIVLAGPGRLSSWDMLTGTPLWHRESLADTAGVPGRHDGGTLCAAAVHGEDIVAWLGRPIARGFEGTGRVMRLSSRTGAVRWTWDPQHLGDETGVLRPSGTPLIHDATAFIPLRRYGRAMEVESWLVALDLESGLPRWHRWLGTAAAPVRGVVWPGDGIIADGDAIVVQTGNGVIASLDPRDGGVDWLRRSSPGRWTSRDATAPPPWSVPTPIRIGDHLVTLSPDRTHMLVLNGDTGSLRSSTPSPRRTFALLPTSDGCMTVGDTIARFALTDMAALERRWGPLDIEPLAAQPHRAGATVLLPHLTSLEVRHMDTGAPVDPIDVAAASHPLACNGMMVLAGQSTLSVRAGLESGLAALHTRAELEPDNPGPLTAMTNLARHAHRPDLLREYLPRALSVAMPDHPELAADTLTDALSHLDADRPEDQALVAAALTVLDDNAAAGPKVHLAHGDWLEDTHPSAAVQAWLQAAHVQGSGHWVPEGDVHAPAEALAAVRLHRHGLHAAVSWPPEGATAGARLRGHPDSPSRSDVLEVIGAARQTVDAVTAASIGGMSDAEITAIRDSTYTPLSDGGEVRRLDGAEVPSPIEAAMVLRDGSRLTWHESPLAPASWSVLFEGAPSDIIAADDDQVVITIDRLGGGRRLESLSRADGTERWTLNLDQLGAALGPPAVLAATETTAALAGRERFWLVDLQSGRPIDHAPAGRPVSALAVGDMLVIATWNTEARRHELHAVSTEGRSMRWPLPPMFDTVQWLARGPLGEVIVGNQDQIAFAPGAGEHFWWVSTVDANSALRAALVLTDAVIVAAADGTLFNLAPDTGIVRSTIETPPGGGAPLQNVLPTGEGMYVLRDTGVSRHDASGELLWADAQWAATAPPLLTMAGDETILVQEHDIVQDVLLSTEARTMHRVRRLDADGRLLDVLDLFPMASRIRRLRTTGGMLLLSDDLDTWLVPLPPLDGPNDLRDNTG